MRHAFSRCLLWIALAGWGAVGSVPQAHADLPYRVSISVKDDSELQETLRSASLLVAQTERPPPTELALRRRVDQDSEQLRQVIRAEGYYAATLDAR